MIDLDALEALHPASFAWALSCCGRRAEDAEEVLQTVYLKIIEGKARFDGRSTLKTWLFSVIRRTAASHFRWRRIFVESAAADSALAAPASRRRHTDDVAEQIAKALAQISTRQREVLELVFFHDMTIEDAARAMGVSLGSARTHYHRGKQRLGRLLEKEGRLVFA